MSARSGGSRSVLMTGDAVGGVFTFAIELARELARARWEVTIALMGTRPTPAQEERVRLAGAKLAVGPYRLEWMDDPWDDVDRAGDWLLALANLLRPDIVHLNGYCHASLDLPAPVVVTGHSCVLSWWAAVRGEPAPPRYDEYGARVRAGLARADRVVAPTRAMLECLGRHYGLGEGGQVIHNGADPSRFWPGRKEPFVLCAARVWDAAKNVSALDKAAARLAWPVLVAGDGRLSDEEDAPALRYARALGPMTQPELVRLYGRAAVYAHPARYEPFGLSVLEAALSGCALVLGDIESLRELWDECAVYVDPDDPDALAGALRWILGSPGAAVRYGARARARALGFTAEWMARRYEGVYLEAGAKRRAREGVFRCA